nr:hypothetical protein [Rhizobium esperanzae]
MIFGFLVAFASAGITFAQDPLADFPLVIVCKTKDTYHVFQLSRVTQDGVATYAGSARIAGTITLHGHAKAIGSPEGGNCLDKTLDELRASGRTRDLKS